MRALLGPASLVCLLSACTVVEEGAEEADLEAGLGGRFDDAPGADDGEHERLVARSVFPPPSGWTYAIYRDEMTTIRSSCLPGTCAPDDERELMTSLQPGGQIYGRDQGAPFGVFKWQWYPGELDPRTGQQYPSWVPIYPYFAIDFFWGCAHTSGGGPVNDTDPCQGGPNQMWTTGSVTSYGAPYFTSGRYFDGYGSRACWDLPATASPRLGLHQCHLGPTQQFQFAYVSCSVEGESCSNDRDCCYHAPGACGSNGTCTY